tara:strand:+ start:966 stop:1151 length:186 start_codon:yes stop_codon:yes gene_type:complete
MDIMSETFYSFTDRKKVTVQAGDISVKKMKVRGNWKYQLIGKHKGGKVYKFTNEINAKKYQ